MRGSALIQALINGNVQSPLTLQSQINKSTFIHSATLFIVSLIVYVLANCLEWNFLWGEEPRLPSFWADL